MGIQFLSTAYENFSQSPYTEEGSLGLSSKASISLYSAPCFAAGLLLQRLPACTADVGLWVECPRSEQADLLSLTQDSQDWQRLREPPNHMVSSHSCTHTHTHTHTHPHPHTKPNQNKKIQKNRKISKNNYRKDSSVLNFQVSVKSWLVIWEIWPSYGMTVLKILYSSSNS